MRYNTAIIITLGLAMQSWSILLMAQTPPSLSTGLDWSSWWSVSTVTQIETQFNAGRRHEESDRSLPANSLGNLNLSDDFLDLDFKTQALILLNAERTARDGINYGSGAITSVPFEGIEIDLSVISQGHADDMQRTGNFSHTGSDGNNSSSRINSVFSGCNQGTGENIAWNSYTGAGFIASIPLAIYNFIYDDACCWWGHRSLCLKQNEANNNYDGTTKYGMVGFGRSTGSNGDYFVMDFFDPVPSCDYNISSPVEGDAGPCADEMIFDGDMASGTFIAISMELDAGVVSDHGEVNLGIADELIIQPNSEIELGSELTISMVSCVSAKTKQQHTLEDISPTDLNTQPTFRME